MKRNNKKNKQGTTNRGSIKSERLVTQHYHNVAVVAVGGHFSQSKETSSFLCVN
jgi:hypothetical protein